MKRSWIGLALLLILLACGLLVTWAMDRCHEPILRDLDDAALFAMAGDWEQAQLRMGRAWGIWQDCWHFSASFADHEPMEDIDAVFAHLEVYALRQEETAFAAACRELSRKVEAMSEAHSLVWWNFV